MRRTALLRVRRDSIAWGTRVPEGVEWREENHYETLVALTEKVEAMVAEVDGRLNVEVWLDPSVVQVRTLVGLPPVKDRHLVALVQNQHDRFFRSAPEARTVAAEWVARRPAKPVARAASVDPSVLDAVENGILAGGGTVAGFTLEPDDRGASLCFVTERMSARDSARLRRRGLVAVVAVLIGWGAYGATYAVDLARDHRSVRNQLAALDEPLERLDSVHARIRAFLPVAHAVERQGSEGAWLGDRLARAVAAIPDSAHLVGISIERSGATTLEIHSFDAIATLDAIQERGILARLVDDPLEELEADLTVERFTIVLGGGR